MSSIKHIKYNTLIFFIALFISLFSTSMAKAQQRDTILTLKECIQYALNNNYDIEKQKLVNNSTSLEKTGAIASLFPSINANGSISANYGRSSNNYSASASMPLFAGFQYLNNIKLSKISILKGDRELSNLENDLIVKIMELYFNALYYNSTIKLGKEQLVNSKKALEKAKILEGLGTKSMADVAQIEAQVATEELFLTKQTNLYNISLLDLEQIMNWDNSKPVRVDTSYTYNSTAFCVNSDDRSTINDADVDEIIKSAIDCNSKIEVYEYNVLEKRKILRIIQGKYLPTIYANGSYENNYYDNLSGGNTNRDGYWNQIKNNKGYGFGVTISIPIFNGLSRRIEVKQQKNNLKIAEKELDRIKLSVINDIRKTAMEFNGYTKENSLAEAKVKAAALAYEAVYEKFLIGNTDPIDLQTSANQLLTAKSEQLNAKLQLIIKSFLLDYYRTGEFGEL